jgi:hypothetical protein
MKTKRSGLDQWTLACAALCTVVGCGGKALQPTPDSGSGVDQDAGTNSDAATAEDAQAADAVAMDAADKPIHPVWEMRGMTAGTTGPRWGAQMAFVPSERRYILFGGSQYPMGTTVAGTYSYSLDTQTWTQIQDTNSPPPRFCHSLIYLPDQHQVLLTGGRDDNGPLPAAAWTLDLTTNAWTKIDGAVPDGVIGPMVAWFPDFPGGGRAVAFGGGATFAANTTWAYDPTAHTYNLLHISHAPTARSDGVMVYDPGPDGGQGRLLLFSGTKSFGPTNVIKDMWSFNGSAWSQMTLTSTAPAGRRVAGSSFDPVRREWIVYSGTNDAMEYQDLWLFDAKVDQWTRLMATGVPPGRGFSAFGYDRADDYYMFGGLQEATNTGMSDGYVLHLRAP